MGRTFWLGKGYSEERIARECERRNLEYDAILVPSEACAEYYRHEYDYRGKVLVTGYPRSDFLVNADSSAVRTEVLERLRVPQGKTTVLYAPTYRDNLTTRTYAAKLFVELDLAQLTRRLGDDVVVLLRGHNNNQREEERITTIRNVVDVTDYPDINELTLAADAAILDYSSLRFDWALTGKPAVFFVPDLHSYFAKRPPLFGFAESAPGPLLTTTAQVAEALADLSSTLAEQAAAIAAFNSTYNRLHDGHASERVVEQFFTN
jgi:CDP-glycerol glycerophosphotransferase